MDESKIKGAATVGGSAAVKPILKNEPQFQSTTSTSSPKHIKQNGDSKVDTTPSKEKRHLKWDEDAIQEHDLLRGTRMKVRRIEVIAMVMSDMYERRLGSVLQFLCNTYAYILSLFIHAIATILSIYGHQTQYTNFIQQFTNVQSIYM